MEFISIINQFVSLLTIAGQVIIVLLIASFIFYRKGENNLIAFFGKNALALGFIAALGGTVASLFYSEVAGYVPCNFCWFQRIFLYPQVILLGMALWKKDTRIADYSIALSSIGGIIAIYHSYIQYGGSPFITCSSAGLCAQRFVFEYGYITIPVMALTAFAFLISVMLAQKLHKNL